jgi:uncharacterized membrane protein YjjP (DUF1212 family)
MLPQKMLQIITPELIQKVQTGAEDMALSILQTVFRSILVGLQPYIPWLIILFCIFLGVAIFGANFGKTKLLGSMIYHTIFFTILIIIVLIYGLKILLNNYFEIITSVIYLVSFKITGIILNKTNNKNGFQRRS